jgi:hypothetical protein
MTKQSGALVYAILLLMTDGHITDMDDTIRALIELATSPCSIIIMGVGDEDFTPMEELDRVD